MKSKQLEHRLHNRHRLRKPVTISWTGEHGQVSCIANGVDVSVYGLLVEASQAIRVGTKVITQIQGSDECLEVSVRHYRKYSNWYRIGLQFATGLRNPQAL